MANKNITISVIIALTLIGTAFVANSLFNNKENGEDVASSQIIVGEGGSDHAHASILIFADNIILNSTWGVQYMLKSNLAHFEGGDNIMIHKHAEGVTLPYFLETLGFKMTSECLSVNADEIYCGDGEKKLRLVVNGEEIEDFNSYEIQHKDRIMIDFSSDDETTRRLKFNSVPVVPEELL